MLNEKQQRFCDYYLSGMQKTESYKKAFDTKHSNADKLLKRPAIIEYLRERRGEPIEKLILDKNKVLDQLYRIVLGEAVGTFTAMTKDGIQSESVKPSASDIIKASQVLLSYLDKDKETADKVNIINNFGKGRDI